MSAGEGRLLVIANPAAQNGRGAAAAELAELLLAERMGRGRVEVARTARAGHAAQIAQEAAGRGFARVVALGGDGVVHEAANGLMALPAPERPAFGVIPVGSGNDYARSLGMSENVEAAVAQIAAAPERVVDVGCCNGEYFVETLSFGLDAAVALGTVELRKHTKQTGALLYLRSGLHQLLHHRDTYQARFELEGGAEGEGEPRLREEPVIMLAVQIGPTYGGGFRICPEARMDDGLFDVCWATGPMGLLHAVKLFVSAKDAHHVGAPEVHFDRASTLRLRFDARPACQVDGEPLPADSYEVFTCPGALRVLVGDAGGANA